MIDKIGQWFSTKKKWLTIIFFAGIAAFVVHVVAPFIITSFVGWLGLALALVALGIFIWVMIKYKPVPPAAS